MGSTAVVLGLVSLFAAMVTGALGYGYSSITVPVSLLVVGNRLLNPALVIVEAVVNAYAAILGRHALRATWRRILPLVIGIVPGVIVGSLGLAALSATTLKVVCYGALLPLILIQAAGVRFRIRRERTVAVPVGASVGVLYALTTISGPPLALYFNNQGLDKAEFKVALAWTRVIESALTLVTYGLLGLLTVESWQLTWWLVPGVAIGMPIGNLLIRSIPAETFRRVCMSFDAWLVAFGLSRLVDDLDVIPPGTAYAILAITLIIDAVLLRRYFGARRQ